ncbi:hypothetical protein EJB05_00162, partial [Eragrostis curvula]
MASPAANSVMIFLLIAAAFATGASAATFSIKNNCAYTVWPAAIPVGGGKKLSPGQTWTLDVPAGTSSGRIWGRTGCSSKNGKFHCETGDCAGALSCTLSGQPPTTLAEFTIGGGSKHDYYDISVVSGYNLPMDFSCSTGVKLVCKEPGCPDAYTKSYQPGKTHHCRGNSNYKVTFCP